MKIFLCFLICLLLSAQNVTSVHNDNNQSSANTNEISLTTSNVAVGKFGKSCSASISGNTFSQPLFLPNVPISGKGPHDTFFVTTMNNNVYAFDAHTCTQLWSTNLGSTWTDYGVCCTFNETFYGLPMGVVGTGVINPLTLKMWVVNSNSTPNHILNRINLTTGVVENTVTISGSVSGTGWPGGGGYASDSGNCVSGSTLTFRTVDNMQVSGLALSPDGSKVYINFGGWENGSTCYHGWVFVYSTTGIMANLGIYCTTPSGLGANPWMSRGAPAVDSSGNVYVVTGNGTYDGITNFGECVLKFSSTLSLLGFFNNPNWSSDNTVDADFGSNRFVLIPGTTYGVAAGKDFSVYLINTTNMSQIQTFKTNIGGVPGSFTGSYGDVFMNNVMYFPTTTGPIYAFSFSSGKFTTSPLFSTSTSEGSHNGQISGSSFGSLNGILWQVTSATSAFTSNPAGTVRALNASTGAELWNSDISGVDTLGNISKFVAPTVIQGEVIVPTNSGTVVVYSLKNSGQIIGIMNSGTIK